MFCHFGEKNKRTHVAQSMEKSFQHLIVEKSADKSKRRSFTTELKLEVISYAEEKGNRAAGKRFEVDESCIREWRKKKKILEQIPKQKKSLRYRKEKFPEMEKELTECINELQKVRNSKVPVVEIRKMAMDIAKRDNLEGFTAGASWCYRFMKRQNLPVRKFVKKERSLVDDWKHKQELFLSCIKRNIKEVPMDSLGNIDEVPITFDITGNRIVDETGKKSVEIITTSFTVVLSATADGSKCIPMVIFKSKVMPEGQFPAGIVVYYNDSGMYTI